MDKLGSARARGPAEADYQPSDPQIANAARFTGGWRALSIDPIVVRKCWLDAYAFATDRGVATLNDWAHQNDPFSKVGRRAIAVEVTSVGRASAAPFRSSGPLSGKGGSAFENDAIPSPDRVTGVDTVVRKPPPNRL